MLSRARGIPLLKGLRHCDGTASETSTGITGTLGLQIIFTRTDNDSPSQNRVHPVEFDVAVDILKGTDTVTIGGNVPHVSDVPLAVSRCAVWHSVRIVVSPG